MKKGSEKVRGLPKDTQCREAGTGTQASGLLARNHSDTVLSHGLEPFPVKPSPWHADVSSRIKDKRCPVLGPKMKGRDELGRLPRPKGPGSSPTKSLPGLAQATGQGSMGTVPTKAQASCPGRRGREFTE